jgi:GNAT superfamily N-acetyltransferase
VAVRLRPVRDDELPGWLAQARRFYVDDLVAHAGLTRDEAEAKAARDHGSLFPEGRPGAGTHAFVVEDDEGSAIGRLSFGERDFGVWLYEVELDPSVRGQGLGREAMLAFEAKARELGAAKVVLNVWGGNDVARSLYRSLGYAEESVHMAKRL